MFIFSNKIYFILSSNILYFKILLKISFRDNYEKMNESIVNNGL